jgi:hypothetical protein
MMALILKGVTQTQANPWHSTSPSSKWVITIADRKSMPRLKDLIQSSQGTATIKLTFSKMQKKGASGLK